MRRPSCTEQEENPAVPNLLGTESSQVKPESKLALVALVVALGVGQSDEVSSTETSSTRKVLLL